MKAPLIEARAVGFRYGDREVLAGVDLDVREGEVVILLGPNGAGKSTLLKILSGYVRPGRGEVALLGKRADRYGRREMARLLSVVGQDPPLDFPMSVEEFVLLGRFPHHGILGGPGAEDRREAARALDMTGLAPLAERPVAELSAGERQRAAVARAIAQGARVMLFDEPTAFLDLYHRVVFYEIVTRLSQTCGVAALVASHDLNLASEYGGRIALLAGGRIAAAGRPDEVLTPGNVREAYGVAVACDRNPATGAMRVTPLRGTAAGIEGGDS